MQNDESAVPETDDIDITSILLEIRRDVKSLDKRFDSLENTVRELKSDNTFLKEQNAELTSSVAFLSNKVNSIEKDLKAASTKNERLEMLIKKNNLKFFNIEEEQNETVSSLENKIKSSIENELGADTSGLTLENAFRIPTRSSPKPILVQFSRFADKQAILTKFRSVRKTNNDLPFRVSEDLPERISKARTDLYPFFKQCKDQGKNAHFKNDVLVVDGVSYTYDHELKAPVTMKR